MDIKQKLVNKNAFVTGSNRGIGKAILEQLAANGANVWAHARKYSTSFENDTRYIANQYGVSIKPVYFDLTDANAMKEIMQPIIKGKDSFDILVNNAGVSHGGLFAMTKIETIKEVFEVNLFAGMELTQMAMKKMSRQKSGAIVNISSVAALHTRIGNSAYGVSKAALKFWTEILAAEVGYLGIRVNAVAPGLTDTEMARKLEEQAGQEQLKSSAMKRMANPEEIAAAVIYLVSDEASFVNGHTLVVNGGGDGD